MEDNDDWLARATQHGSSGLGLELGSCYHVLELIFINQ
jgi:hypothetical protein